MNTIDEVIDDYIERMEGINEKRIELCQEQLDYEQAEMRAFNILRQNLFLLGRTHGISEDKLLVQERGDELQPYIREE